ncbi:hypothetical protein QBC44DRAFT_325618 [Cladorrhinum sp. PSN332]|nr:hypothetical protein QBC44DRAFT_325618 [Cladorrhinum sp. PSN332]
MCLACLPFFFRDMYRYRETIKLFIFILIPFEVLTCVETQRIIKPEIFQRLNIWFLVFFSFFSFSFLCLDNYSGT